MKLKEWYCKALIQMRHKRLVNSDNVLLYLISHVLHISGGDVQLKIYVVDCDLSITQRRTLDLALRLLLRGQALSKVLHSSFFCGYEFYVNEHVLCPRQVTEAVVHTCIEYIYRWNHNAKAKEQSADIITDENAVQTKKSELSQCVIIQHKSEEQYRSLCILDLGTGSGCIPISIYKLLHEYAIGDAAGKSVNSIQQTHISESAISSIRATDTQINYNTHKSVIPIIYSVDISEKALEVAQGNACHHHANICFLKSNWFNVFERGDLKFDIIISNPPYIDKKEYVHKTAKYDPALALYAKQNGFEAYHIILTSAGKFLHTNGIIIFEIPYKFIRRLYKYGYVITIKRITKNICIVICQR